MSRVEAQRAVLRHSSDTEPGNTRKRHGPHWAYFDADGKRITDRDEIDRLNAIALPPAYSDAWFCADPERPSAGDRRRCARAQAISLSRRFPRRSAKARSMKGCSSSARRCRKLRRRVEQDLKRRKLTRDTVLAAVVRLLDTEHIRIGNEQYATRQQELRRDHAAQPAPPAQGQQADDALHRQARDRPRSDDHRHATSSASCKRCQDLPGQMLFQYVNGDGEPQPVTSGDVNDYIREATGGDFTAKHFRTWSASVIAFDQMLKKAEHARITRQDGGRAGRRSARQHAGDQPQVLCPSRAARSGQGRRRATRSTAWSGRAPASACRAPKSRCSSFSRKAQAKRSARPPPRRRLRLDAAAASGNRRDADRRQPSKPIRSGREGVSSRLVRANREGVLIGARGRRGHRRRHARAVADRRAPGWPANRNAGIWLADVIGRVLAKTTILFMVMAALDIVATYAAAAARVAAAGRHRSSPSPSRSRARSGRAS